MRNLFLFIIAICYSVISSAQGKITIGPEISSTRTNILVSHSSGVYNRTSGGGGGVSLNDKLSNHLSIQSGLFLDEKGAAGKIFYDSSTVIVYDGSVQYSSEYLSLPLLIRFSTKGQFQFFSDAGIYFAYLLRYDMRQFDVIHFTQQDTNIKGKTHALDAGLALGVGVRIAPLVFKRLSMSCELRESYGLVPLENKSYAGNAKSYNNSVGFYFGVAYTI